MRQIIELEDALAGEPAPDEMAWHSAEELMRTLCGRRTNITRRARAQRDDVATLATPGSDGYTGVVATCRAVRAARGRRYRVGPPAPRPVAAE